MNMNKPLLTGTAVLLLASSALRAQYAGTGTTTMSVAIGAEASIQVTTSTTTLTTVGSLFNNYTGTTNLSYKIRTTQSSGNGALTLKVTADFSPANGPSVASPPNAGDLLTYTCTVAAPGTACSGSQTSSTASATSVSTFGAGANSGPSGNTASTAWTLVNDPAYQTGSYSATITYTISST